MDAGSASPRKTAFVTGANGFLGLNLVNELLASGWEVFALHRATSDLRYLRRFPVRLVEASIEDAASLERAMPEGVDALFHVAADVTFWSRHKARQSRTNVDGTRNVVAVALKRGVRKFVHTSTTSVYGFAASPFDETAPHLGRDSWIHYMKTKVEAEDEVRKGIDQGLDAVILNPANIIGPYDCHNWSRLIRLTVENELPCLPPGRASFCHSVAVAKAHIAAASRGRTGENYILGGAGSAYTDLVRLIGEVVGRPVRVATLPPFVFRAAGRVLSLVASVTGKEPLITPESAAFLGRDLTCTSDRAIRELGYEPSPLRAMLEDCYRWMVAEGRLRAV